MTSGRKNPGAPSNTKTKTSTATVPTTSRPVMISFFCNCILASFQNGTFGAAAQELSDDWIFGLLGQADDQFVDDRRNHRVETGHRFVEKDQFRLEDKGPRQTHAFFHPAA